MEALNIDIIYASRLYVKWLLKYQVLNFLCTFAQRSIQPEGSLGRFDGEVIRVKETLAILELFYLSHKIWYIYVKQYF